eukprot:TRINITY_DN34620_c0_g1_i1.p1 TRINITY_DN34620_c0_g1~~TRINITY_DN34620_c0_g1_i1.p1  ORF type:complete len:1048 (+),score=198.16 TRINITY_DN34620_c0_g1_i1:197-3145(+)
MDAESRSPRPDLLKPEKHQSLEELVSGTEPLDIRMPSPSLPGGSTGSNTNSVRGSIGEEEEPAASRESSSRDNESGSAVAEPKRHRSRTPVVRFDCEDKDDSQDLWGRGRHASRSPALQWMQRRPTIFSFANILGSPGGSSQQGFSSGWTPSALSNASALMTPATPGSPLPPPAGPRPSAISPFGSPRTGSRGADTPSTPGGPEPRTKQWILEKLVESGALQQLPVRNLLPAVVGSGSHRRLHRPGHSKRFRVASEELNSAEDDVDVLGDVFGGSNGGRVEATFGASGNPGEGRNVGSGGGGENINRGEGAGGASIALKDAEKRHNDVAASEEGASNPNGGLHPAASLASASRPNGRQPGPMAWLAAPPPPPPRPSPRSKEDEGSAPGGNARVSEPPAPKPKPPEPKEDSPGKGSAPSEPPRKGKGRGVPPPMKAAAPGGKGKAPVEPRKPEVTPSIPLKRLLWTPFTIASKTGEVKGATVWEKIHSKGAKFDATELEDLFGETVRPKASQPTEDGSKPKQAKKRIFDERRRRALWFMLALMPDRTILPDAIFNMDDSVLEAGKIDLLLSNLPNNIEEVALRDAMRTPLEEEEVWDVPEDFMMMMLSVPEYSLRLQVWGFLHNFEEIISRITAAEGTLRKAVTDVRNSPRIEKLLALSLFVGNYLNAGTTKGRADGFDMDTLMKIPKFKAEGSEGSLLDYIVRQSEKDSPNMLREMYEPNAEFSSVHAARKYKIADAEDELAGLFKEAERYVHQIDRLTVESKISSDDALLERGRQVSACDLRMRGIDKSLQKLKTDYIELCAWFNMDTEKPRPADELFGIWNAFLTDVKQALDKLEKKRQAALQKMKRAVTLSISRTRTPQLQGSTVERRRISEPQLQRPASQTRPFRRRASLQEHSDEASLGNHLETQPLVFVTELPTEDAPRNNPGGNPSGVAHEAASPSATAKDGNSILARDSGPAASEQILGRSSSEQGRAAQPADV